VHILFTWGTAEVAFDKAIRLLHPVDKTIFCQPTYNPWLTEKNGSLAGSVAGSDNPITVSVLSPIETWAFGK